MTKPKRYQVDPSVGQVYEWSARHNTYLPCCSIRQLLLHTHFEEITEKNVAQAVDELEYLLMYSMDSGHFVA